MLLLCICHSAPCAGALTALKEMEGKLQTRGMKRRPSEASLACPLHVCECVCEGEKVWRGEKTEFTLFVCGSSFRSWKCTLVFSAQCFLKPSNQVLLLQPAHAAPATHAIACVCLCSPWQAASSCWTWHLSWCYQVAEAITPLPGPPGHSVYLSRFGRQQRRESWWRLGCRV